MESKPHTLVLLAHPALHRSRVNRPLAARAEAASGVTLHDLYETYPDYLIDVPHEQELLVAHETIVLQHPFYWYSCPPLLKQWIDLVLTYGFAFGHDGVALQGKRMITATSTGGSAETYDAEGLNHYTMREFLRPFEQTARLCRMTYLPPFVIPGTHKRPDKDIPAFADRYARLLDWLPELSVTDQLLHRETINDLIPD